jgi:tetratricopeptide (TPR) repeat protein
MVNVHMNGLDKQVLLGESGSTSRPRFRSKEESSMKWFMVSAMTVALLFGSAALAQEDDFDLDALLGDFDSPPAEVDVTAADSAPAAEAVEEAVAESEPVAAAEAVEDAAVEAAPFAGPEAAEAPVAEAVEEMGAEADPFADLGAVEEPMEEVAEEAAFEADPFASLDAMEAPAEEVAEEALAEADPFAGMDAMEEPEIQTMEDSPAEPMAEAPMEGDDLLGDLFAEPAAPAEAEPVAELDSFDAFAPAMDEPMAGGMEEELFVDDEAPAGAPAEAAAAEVELSPREIKKIAREAAKQEEIRRQAAETDALKASEAGFRAMSDGSYIAAETNFSYALTLLPDRPQNAAIREQISWGLAEAQYLRARALVQKRERLADARKLVTGALAAVPDHRGALALDRRLSRLEELESLPKAPSRQPATIEKMADINQMYDEARQWYMVKDYDRALALFEQVLLRDPYHKSAIRYIHKIEADKYKLASYERDARIQGMMTEVRRTWNPPIRADIEVPQDIAKSGGLDSKPASERLNEKMQKIIIPAVEFRQANINDVVNFLVEASIAADPEKEGVKIILNLGQSGGGGAAPAPAPAMDDWGFGGDDFGAPMAAPSGGGGSGVRDITLNLRRISMLDAIKYITEVAGLKYRIEDSAVMITPLDAPVGNIITRMYPSSLRSSMSLWSARA